MHFLHDHESGFFSESGDSDCLVATANTDDDTVFGLLSKLFVSENADDDNEGEAGPGAAF